MSAEYSGNLSPREALSDVLRNSEKIIEPYQDRRFIPTVGRARDDAFLYALGCSDQCRLSLFIHGPNMDSDEKSMTLEWLQKLEYAITGTINENWLPMRKTLLENAQLEISNSTIGNIDDSFRNFAEETQRSGEALARLASFLNA